jgi:hypothetical protein
MCCGNAEHPSQRALERRPKGGCHASVADGHGQPRCCRQQFEEELTSLKQRIAQLEQRP